MLEEDALRFDQFLKDNDQKAVQAIKKAEAETKAKAEKVQEIKKLNAQITQIKSEMSKFEEQLEDCRKCARRGESLPTRCVCTPHCHTWSQASLGRDGGTSVVIGSSGSWHTYHRPWTILRHSGDQSSSVQLPTHQLVVRFISHAPPPACHPPTTHPPSHQVQELPRQAHAGRVVRGA